MSCTLTTGIAKTESASNAMPTAIVLDLFMVKVDAFTGPARQHDDITCLVMKAVE